MSIESNRWTELTDLQAGFFADQLDAMGQTAFSMVAQGAGIIAAHAQVYDFTLSQSRHNMIMWPNPFVRRSACVLTACRQGTEPSSFMQLTRTTEGYNVEGVAVRLLAEQGEPVNLYGRQHFLPSDDHAGNMALQFLDIATEHAWVSKAAKPFTDPETSSVQHVGIEDEVIGELFTSLNSFHFNLTTKGRQIEQGIFTDQLYDLAQTFLKIAISGAQRNLSPNAGTVLLKDGRPNGAMFESTQHGITVVRRTSDYPNTIAIASTLRPGVGETHAFVEQYSIQGRDAFVDTLIIPASQYGQEGVLEALARINVNPRHPNNNSLALLGFGSMRILEQKIASLLKERTNETV